MTLNTRTKSAQRPCPISREREVMLLHHQRFLLPNGNPLPAEYDVVWSPRAGFAYADTTADQATYDRYYADFSKYEDNTTSTGGAETGSDAARLADAAGDIARIIPDREVGILDMGCANGGLLMALQRLGYRSLMGVDPSRACVNAVRSKPGLCAEVGGLFDLPALPQAFDFIILSHVLEHVCDLRGAVQVLHASLADKGIVYCEVPDATRYREFVFAPFQDFNTEHINHFSQISLENLFRNQGFQTVSMGARMIRTSPQCPYPVIFGFFRESSAAQGPAIMQGDDHFLRSLQDYIAQSSAKLARIEVLIEPITQARTPLVVWGTGQLTMKLLAETSLRRANLVAFVDGNPINYGKSLLGRAIRAPHGLHALKSDTVILIASLLHQEAITRKIRGELGLTNKIIVLND